MDIFQPLSPGTRVVLYKRVGNTILIECLQFLHRLIVIALAIDKL